jgi:hypothetical protein
MPGETVRRTEAQRVSGRKKGCWDDALAEPLVCNVITPSMLARPERHSDFAVLIRRSRD